MALYNQGGISMKNTKILSILLVLALMFGMCGSMNAFAAETTDFQNSNLTVETSNSSVASVQTTSFGPGDWYWGGFTFYDYNVGAYKTINGNQVKIKVAFKAVDGQPYSYILSLDCYEYGGNCIYSRNLNSWSVSPDSDGYYYYESGWINVNYGVDYHFVYGANSSCACDDPRTLNVHVWIEVQ